MAVGHRSRALRPPLMMAIALVLGLLIAFIDSRPGWDSTGITAGALLLGGGTAAYLGRTRPWLWALLVGLPTPVIEISSLAAVGSLLALLFASVGAAIGWGLSRAG
jgi:hypothetical protein